MCHLGMGSDGLSARGLYLQKEEEKERGRQKHLRLFVGGRWALKKEKRLSLVSLFKKTVKDVAAKKNPPTCIVSADHFIIVCQASLPEFLCTHYST